MCSRSVLHDNKICRNASEFSRLLFADNSFFLTGQCGRRNEIKNLFDAYERVSGQAINYIKSGIYFSKNMGRGEGTS